jgi:TRAP-type C4-dicarboxylate transport system permease small subunit
MTKLIAGLDRIIERVLVTLMILIVLSVSWQVFSRYLLQTPSSTSEEIARFLLIWISMIGAVYCYRTKAHLGLNILTNKMKAKQKKNAELLSHVLIFCFSALVLVVGGSQLVNLSYHPVQTSPALNLPMGLIYLVLPISGLLFCFYAVVECFALHRAELKGQSAVNEVYENKEKS